jgi:hypothetical protein
MTGKHDPAEDARWEAEKKNEVAEVERLRAALADKRLSRYEPAHVDELETEVERLRAQLEQADRSYVEQGIRLLAERAEVKRLRLAMEEEVEAECRRWRTNRLGVVGRIQAVVRRALKGGGE